MHLGIGRTEELDMEYEYCPTTCESDVEEDVLVLVEVPTGPDGRKRQIRHTRRPPYGWQYAWTMSLLCLVLTLVLINDMITYGKFESKWQREEAALQLLREAGAYSGGRQVRYRLKGEEQSIFQSLH